jgi:O-antigen ligase
MLLTNPHQATPKKALLSKLLLLLWPLYQLSQFPFIRAYFMDLVVLLLFVVQVRKIKLSHPLLKPLLFFLSTATISLLVAFISGSGSPLALLYLLRLFLYSSLLFISLPKNTSSLLVTSFFIVPVLGLLQYLLFPDLRFLKAIGYDDHYFRLTFPFLDPNYTGAVLAFISLYSIKIVKTTKGKILLPLSLIALALTFSRISFLGFFVGLVYLFLKNKKLRLPVVLALVGLVLTIVISPKPFGEGVNLKRTFSITARVNNINKGLELFSDHPLLGVGYNTLPFSTTQRSSAGLDNSFIFVLATMGTVGLIGFMYLLFKVWAIIPNVYLKAAFISLVIHSLSNNSLFYAPITILVFLILNLSARKTPL